ncbi:Protein-glutamate methylesterase [Pseudomonas sp. XWY-1]|jgi:two-component system chemotaxis response regulator CheB|uniref:protein-glutamate methylesterase n=2 Tax=Pseudomonas putida group TaxID=136845 RepID=Q88GG5_PSEPK|nr:MULTISPECIES: chemotaxis protein CheB [Pseudomonas]HBM65886.1 chemotaxis protein CheB [Pseudomonas sp.]AAN69353.1 Methylesterase, CheB-like [Pseudomonas putida KT2440]AUZ58800.1 Protein-glutamate methylesterase [Pseudomonas sp. XWY-1]KMU97200.1 chemotaxis protein CheB [Pseudomonas putida]KMY31003.1 chemotaxis protein CheB [Pseudomonas putida]
MSGVRAVVIGASAGGVAALFQVLGTLPSAFAIPVLCVLHLPDDRHSQLAGVLQRRLHRPVCEARDKESISSGQIYVAGPGYHLSVERDLTLSLSQEEPVHFSRPAIDFLFISAADAYGDGLLGVLLTGANEDGARGLAYIKNNGGRTIVQDPRDAQVALMPEAALALHQPDHILTLSGIGQLLATLEYSAC